MYHFEEQVGLSEMLFDYKIRTGKAVSRNAINLLKLMGFDDDDFYKAKNAGISDTQLYRQAGNSIVVNVLEKILECLFE